MTLVFTELRISLTSMRFLGNVDKILKFLTRDEEESSGSVIFHEIISKP